MNQDVENLLKVLEPSIDEKCKEIRHKKEEKAKERLFVFIIMILLIVPSSLVFIGLNLIYTLIIISILLSIILLSLTFSSIPS